MKYCEKCGNPLNDIAAFCTKCGHAVNEVTVNRSDSPQNQAARQNYGQTGYSSRQTEFRPLTAEQIKEKNLIDSLCSKIQAEAIVWIVVASLQIIIGLIQIFRIISTNHNFRTEFEGTYGVISGILFLVIAFINYFVSYEDFERIKKFNRNPAGIVDYYQPVGGLVASLIYNLIFGGIIGVVGTIFGFVTRGFVMENAQAFLEMEKKTVRHDAPKKSIVIPDENHWQCSKCGTVNYNYVGTCSCGQTRVNNQKQTAEDEKSS